MKNFTGILFFIVLIFSSCAEDKKPEDLLKDFVFAANDGKSLHAFHNESHRIIETGYTKTRKYAEKLNPETISCETNEDEADCSCKTESGKIRNFKLYFENNEWKVSLNEPEIILEIFHIMYTNGMLKEAMKFATKTEKDRMEVFLSMTENMEIPETDKKIIPFKIKCKTFKKKQECICLSEEGESSYVLFKTSKGWKAELGENSIISQDSIVDYNSSEDFNLNQHDLDSLTDFSQKMLDSMLNL